ncbi:MAG: hypothetical protein CL609_15320 [Anaerolineaceae bacterium]|nr:hypothetical protein [Anaerolineaceae bacterium]
MNKTLTIVLIVIAGIVLSALVFGAGMFLGHANYGFTNFSPAGMMGWRSNYNNTGPGMMGNSYSGMMGNGYGGMMGNGYGGMMGNGYGGMMGNGYGGMMGNGYGGMMGNGYGGMMGNGYGGMMGGYPSNSNPNTKPLTLDQAKQAFEGYLKDLNNSDLEIKEIMVFDNNGYAIINEKSTGIGAMELLVDPESLSVFPEYGPNMMWNLKYGHMNGAGMMGGFGMMGNRYASPDASTSTMSVSPDEAAAIAQQYLDQQFPGSKTSEDVNTFYGYYTIDILNNGSPTGMLSVNGFSGQVFLHTWHGNFIDMVE